MDTINILNYLEKRQLGYKGFKENIHDIFIKQMGYIPPEDDSIHIANSEIGNTFACKFSRNKNNLHIVGCSSEHGEMIIQNTTNHCFSVGDSPNKQFVRNVVHDNAIFNFAWSEPQMKLVTACGDQTSKLCNLCPSGKLDEEREFIYNSSVKSVMFCPGSSDIFCGGCQDSSIKIWDARINNSNCVLKYEHNIPNSHGIFRPIPRKNKSRKVFGISCVIFKDDKTVISCASMDPAIKLWDLRKSYRQVNAKVEPLPLMKYTQTKNVCMKNCGYIDMIINPQYTRLYASGINNVINCFSLDSTEKEPLCEYSGHCHETGYSKISISNDGRYLFSGCMDNTGVIWLTDFPYVNKPVFKMLNKKPDSRKELSTSDWCADPAYPKLVVSADSMPMVWSLLTKKEINSLEVNIFRTSSYKPKSLTSKMHTVPIKFELELAEKLKNETEINMETWDLQDKKLVPSILPTTSKKPWEMLFTKTSSPSPGQLSPTHTLHVSNQIPEVITPTSKKRKQNVISPRSLIDQYLVPNSKQKRLNIVNEI